MYILKALLYYTVLYIKYMALLYIALGMYDVCLQNNLKEQGHIRLPCVEIPKAKGMYVPEGFLKVVL